MNQPTSLVQIRQKEQHLQLFTLLPIFVKLGVFNCYCATLKCNFSLQYAAVCRIRKQQYDAKIPVSKINYPVIKFQDDMVSSFIRTELKIDNSIFSNLVNFFQTSRLQMFSHLPLTPQHMQVIYTITWNILTYAENAPRFDKRRHRNQS